MRAVKGAIQLLFLVSACVATAAEGPPDPAPIVVSVGVNRSFDSRLGLLSYAETDAERFAHAMETVGHVAPRDLMLLKSPTVEEFVATVQGLVRSRRKDSGPAPSALRLVLYFSGHADDRGLHFRGGPLSRDLLHEMLRELDVATRVVVLDSCFAGSIAAKGVESAEPFLLPKLDLEELSGTVFLTAASARERAFESEELSGSVFTHYVIAGLNGGADANRDGLVTVDELYQYVYRETRLRSSGYPGDAVQRPEYHAELHGRGAIVLSRPRRESGTLRVDTGIMGTINLVSTSGLGNYRVHGGGDTAAEFPVPEGAYRALIRRGDRFGEASVYIARGETVELRASQFEWATLDIQVAEVSKGGGAPLATAHAVTGAMRMVAMRKSMGEELQGYELGMSAPVFDLVSAKTRMRGLAMGGTYESHGKLTGAKVSAIGASGGLGLLLMRSGTPARGLVGLGYTQEWQSWEKSEMKGGSAKHTMNGPVATAGLFLPMTDDSEGRQWSIFLQRIVRFTADDQGRRRLLDQVGMGLAVE